MLGLLGVLLLIALMAFGVPVAWAFASVLAYLTFVYDVSLDTLMLQGFRSLNSVVLVALPLFVLAGYVMQHGGIARRLVTFVERLVHGQKGGLGASMVLASGIYGAIAGTATAAVASVGTIMLGPLQERGYPRGYAAALLGKSSLLGILIPPSITMILFAVVTRQSVAACFAATIGPAILLIIGLILFNRLAVGRLFEELPAAAENEVGLGRATWSALPALSIPAIILGGIYGGIFTPTEAAAVAVFAALVIGALVYRDLSLSELRAGVVRATETTGTIILILLFSFMIGRVLAFERVPQELTELVQTFATDPVLALILVNAVLVIAGAIMDDISVTVVIAPLFLPLVVQSGVDPVHFAAIVACSVVIGANSPPVAPVLYLACRVGRAPVHQAVVPALMLIGCVGLPVMLATTFWPALSLTLPRLLGFS